MAVGPLGKPPHQPILRGEDEAAVLVIVGELEDTQELQAQREREREDTVLNCGCAWTLFVQEE